jgi:glycosyltransferase involved in cell wall biosynthesis|tara:strand:+ start:2477 stop:3430 length:954 start_codon:yes stop_codon:yes gene_type:complete
LDISIVIPLLNEAESLPELHAWIKRVMDEHTLSYEVIFIDDGSTDESWSIIEQLKNSFSEVKGLKFRRNYGKSAALNEGFALAQGDSVFTMDADLQDSPEELPAMHKMLWEEGFDLVSGWKQKRYDPITKTLPTKLYNWATRRMSGIFLHDFNCGLKAYKNEVVKSIEVYGEMHRYIPVMAHRAGYKKIGEKVVQHQSRKYGTTKFGLSRFVRGPLDLLSIIFVSKFGKRPMHFFGLWGAIAFLLGFSLTAFVLIQKFIALANGMRHTLVADNPLFYLALTMLIVGSQLFMGGFLAEMISRNALNRNQYEISERIGF